MPSAFIAKTDISPQIDYFRSSERTRTGTQTFEALNRIGNGFAQIEGVLRSLDSRVLVLEDTDVTEPETLHIQIAL